MKEFKIEIPVKELSFEELNDQDRRLVEEAKNMTYNAYAPYSGYRVGAAILMDNGRIVTGSNQESAAYPSGLCAERTAAFYAGSAHPGQAMKKLAVAAWTDPGAGKKHEAGFQKHPVSPCGGCRQSLSEYEKLYGDIEVILYGSEKIYIFPSVSSLLPLTFTEF